MWRKNKSESAYPALGELSVRLLRNPMQQGERLMGVRDTFIAGGKGIWQKEQKGII